MSNVMDEEIKRGAARCESSLVLDIIQGKTIVAEASRQFNLNHRWIARLRVSEPLRDPLLSVSSRPDAIGMPGQAGGMLQSTPETEKRPLDQKIRKQCGDNGEGDILGKRVYPLIRVAVEEQLLPEIK